MNQRKTLVEEYFEGFRQGNRSAILDCLTDDVAWDLPGFRHLVGKEEFDSEIENEAFTGRPKLTVDRLIQEDLTVVAIGHGEAQQVTGELHRFAFCDVFTFSGEKICRVESYLVALGE
ncbi:MAG: nuclear transport factor 2 family protein [Actinomycetota bacterium]|nr:nuclear transport factor 2 family protein [Actinomycetota bacterium]